MKGGRIDSDATGTVVNQGLIKADQRGITIQPSSFTNDGIVEAINGGDIFIVGDLGAHDGTFNVGPGSQIAVTGDLIQGGLANLNVGIAGPLTSEFGKVVVNGSVALNGSLDITLESGFVPASNDSFTILINDDLDVISGMFDGLPESGIVSADGSSFEITYVGADGNDVVLTAVNEPPTITSTSSTSIAENSTAVMTVTAMDNDAGQTVTLSIIGSGPDDDLFSILPTGELSFINAPDFEMPQDFNSDNVYEVEVMADDGNGGTATQTIGVTVLNQASITGSVFVDVNGNSLFDGNEPGIDGVVVELLDSGGTPVLDQSSQAITATTSDGGFILFEDLDPGTYQLHQQQPTGVSDGAEILGSLGGTIVANDTMQLTLAREDASDYDFAELGQELTSGDTATIGFWQNKHGQALITAGGVDLAMWLSTNFDNVFGNTFTDAMGSNDGAEVASFYKNELFKQKAKKSAGPAKVDAQFMATALATYFTSSNLAGVVAEDFGFNVTQTGIGTNIVNVGSSGAAFGVADGTDLTIMQLLIATNDMTDLPDYQSGAANVYDLNGDGIIDAAEAALRDMANAIYSMINES